MPGLTVEQILMGTTTGRMQSVGQMAVIPILGERPESQDESFAPPDFNAGTQGYGRVRVQNRSDAPTILPTGSAFITPEKAQDHAVPGASLMKGAETKDIANAYCVQQTQAGLMTQKERDFTILPVALRAPALAHRKEATYNALWDHITKFRASYGDSGVANLVEFLGRFEKELDEFVAQFEVVPHQIGALVLIAGQVVGIERAPNVAFWNKIWTPLIRVCYGTLALRVGRENRAIPETRLPLGQKAGTLDALRVFLSNAKVLSQRLVEKTLQVVGAKDLLIAPDSESMGKSKLLTLASREYSGQLVYSSDKPVYVSVCASAA